MFDEDFGAVFSFPPNATNATAHIKGSNGIPQLYVGSCDNETIKGWLLIQLRLARADEQKQAYEDGKKWRVII